MSESKGKSIGCKLPGLDIYIVRGRRLRQLQQRCHDAEENAALRSRMLGRLMAKAFNLPRKKEKMR